MQSSLSLQRLHLPMSAELVFFRSSCPYSQCVLLHRLNYWNWQISTYQDLWWTSRKWSLCFSLSPHELPPGIVQYCISLIQYQQCVCRRFSLKTSSSFMLREGTIGRWRQYGKSISPWWIFVNIDCMNECSTLDKNLSIFVSFSLE